MKLLITGARGFIGSAFIRTTFDHSNDAEILAFARNTTDWTRPRLETPILRRAMDAGRLKFVFGDLLDDISGLCEGVDAVIHFAAKTFVDHSIRDPGPFITSNTLGTTRLLEEAHRQGVKAFITVSTDEVYGQILEGSYDESAPINPRNPYAASKAGADAITIAYHHTFKMWTAVTRTENNYGPYQHPQKAMPVFVKKALNDEPLPIYGDGKHVRQWLHVSDHVYALMRLLRNYESLPGGEVWHVAGQNEVTNTDLALKILKILGKPESLITFIDDHNIRPGHDRRYALSCDKIMKAVGWKPSISLENGLESAVRWYAENRAWLGV